LNIKLAQESNKYVLYILFVTLFVTSSLAMFQAAIRVVTQLIKSGFKNRKNM